MPKQISTFLFVSAFAYLLLPVSGFSQVLSMGETVANWANACQADVEASCSKVGPGSGKLIGCLQQRASAGCKSASSRFSPSVQARLDAQAQAPRLCKNDVERLCPNFKVGNARILRCMTRPENFRQATRSCKDGLKNAGWLDQVSIRSAGPDPKVDNALTRLGGSATRVGIDTAAVRRDILARIQAEGNDNAPSGATELDILRQLPNFIVQIQFFLDSEVIKPESWVIVGRIADALHHPLLAGNRFLIVGHTDTSGTRTHNLDLSQRRAAAITQMLIAGFGVPARRLLSVGLGEEQLLEGLAPNDPVHRRVELINIGPV